MLAGAGADWRGRGGFLVYRRVTQLVNDLEVRQVAPLREKVEAILGDVKTVTSRVSQQTERVTTRSRERWIGSTRPRNGSGTR